MSLRTIQFTQEQARDIARVSPGDMRQWRKSVVYLDSKTGKAARFAFSDLVGLALTREFTGTLGARISEIGVGVDALFRALAQARPAHLAGLLALVERADARLVSTHDLIGRQVRERALIAPCDPILVEIGERMMPVAPALSQTPLPFPPQAIRSGT